MAAVIALRPEDERGLEILYELDGRTGMRPEQVVDDGTHRYYLDAPDANVNAFDPVLDEIDPDWRSHLTSWREEPESAGR